MGNLGCGFHRYNLHGFVCRQRVTGTLVCCRLPVEVPGQFTSYFHGEDDDPSPTISAATFPSPAQQRLPLGSGDGVPVAHPAFGILGVLHAVFTILVAGLAVYALVLTITFLRLRIAELKRTAPPKR